MEIDITDFPSLHFACSKNVLRRIMSQPLSDTVCHVAGRASNTSYIHKPEGVSRSGRVHSKPTGKRISIRVKTTTCFVGALSPSDLTMNVPLFGMRGAWRRIKAGPPPLLSTVSSSHSLLHSCLAANTMMFIKAILALSLASLSLAAPANEPRQLEGILPSGGNNPLGGAGKSCSSLRPIEW